MAASHNVAHPPTVSQIPRHGTLCLFGFGICVSVVNGHLSCHDGIGNERRAFLLPKVNSNLKRLVLVGSDGMVTLEALRWIADREASFCMLDRRGKVVAVCGPSAPTDARLRRSQSFALANGTALRISRDLIRQKLEGQAALVREMLRNCAVSTAIQRLTEQLSDAESIESVRIVEAQAAKLYWQAWSDLPVRWPRNDEKRVPEHWKHFGSRISPLTHSPRLAANPPNAILNLLYAVLEAESRLAAVAMGLDPGIGLLHVDTPNRDSLACDLQESVRASVDAFLLNWLQRELLRKADFFEDRNGNCRLVSALAIKLCETADTWRKLVAPVAEYVAKEIWATIPRTTSRLGRQLLATRLTQANKREVKGSEVPPVTLPKVDHHCPDCGAKVPSDKERCFKCWKRVTRVNFGTGRKAAQRPEFLAKRAATMQAYRQEISSWKPSDLPAWLTRDVYSSATGARSRCKVPNTYSARGERTAFFGYPCRQARSASPALAGAGKTGWSSE